MIDSCGEYSFIKLADPSGEYGEEAVARFRKLCDSRKLVANVDHREGSLLHLRLIDPEDPTAATDPAACVNVELARDGLATLDRKGCKYLKAYPALVDKIKLAINDAKRDRAGMFEFGDIEEDE
jgi:staphylococcal nuclease domain-containing protein 1